jgi:glycyl-tRNA synthetase beta chain
MPAFLLEIGTEEIPASFLSAAALELRSRLITFLDESGVEHGEAKVFYTPRRLAVLCEGVGSKQKDTVALVTGPPLSSAYDENGRPTKAALGFAKAHGVKVGDLSTEPSSKRKVLALRQKRRGRRTSSLLSEYIPRLLASINFPKSMRWEPSMFTFARPIRWIVALLGSQTLRFRIAGVKSGAETFGHRFLSPGPKRIDDPTLYEKVLQKMHVVPDPQKRSELIVSMLDSSTKPIHGTAMDDPELIEEVNGLVEEPNPIVGRFDSKYLRLPQEVVITAMREHQRYFSVLDDTGKLLPYFVAIANGKTRDDRIVQKGYEDILVSKLEDAAFHWEEDRKRTLQAMVSGLKSVVWQENLGSLYDKCQRLVELTKHICLRIDEADHEKAERAAYLCKADLVSEMVRDGKEFAKLQGVMGREYALASKEDKRVAVAIQEHYMPRYPGDPLPQTPEGAVVSIADRLDSIVGLFINGQIPTGSEDPYGLRRLANGMIAVVVEGEYHLSLLSLVSAAMDLFANQFTEYRFDRDSIACSLIEFLSGRMEAFLGEKGVTFDVTRAVMSSGLDDLTDATQRALAFTRFRERDEFKSLVIGQKRVVNILKGLDLDSPLDESLFTDAEEKRLLTSTRNIEDELRHSLTSHDYGRALELLLSLKDPIDQFFDRVLVMAEDPVVRNNRLALVSYVADRFTSLADFSEIVTE